MESNGAWYIRSKRVLPSLRMVLFHNDISAASSNLDYVWGQCTWSLWVHVIGSMMRRSPGIVLAFKCGGLLLSIAGSIYVVGKVKKSK